MVQPEPVRRDAVWRRTPLPAGRALVVRPVDAGDVDGLDALYAGLDADDRYRRFFSAYHPTRQFLERMATAAPGRGFGLVAVAHSGGSHDIVGEADYALLPNGDGELAITVTRAWRGWLGPYLLDALVTAAADRGVPNLEADVLVTNRPMLALLRSRGAATMDHPDWTVVRLLIGTATRIPTWPGRHDRPRLLVEGAGGRWHGEEAARQAGLEVLVCPGPVVQRRRCPALSGSPCPLVTGADLVVQTRPTEDEAWSKLDDGHRRLHADVPVCVEQPSGKEMWQVRGGPDARSATVVTFLHWLADREARRSA